MIENNLAFLKDAFPEHQIQFSDDFTDATIFNPFYEENITVSYDEALSFDPFCACFSFQHRHLIDENDVINWINDIISGNRFAIEFFKNEQRCFGGDIEAAELKDLSYAKLEQSTGYYGFTKLLDVADSFKIRGWERRNNWNAVFVQEPDGTVAIQQHNCPIIVSPSRA